jgi:hypothetical protein
MLFITNRVLNEGPTHLNPDGSLVMIAFGLMLDLSRDYQFQIYIKKLLINTSLSE